MSVFQKYINSFLFCILLIFCSLFTSSCISTTPNGLNPKYEGYISAKIATFPCQIWPTNLKFKEYKSTNVDGDTMRKSCEYFDKFIVDIFRNQPFIQGMSASLTYKTLKAQSLESDLDIRESWNHYKSCVKCATSQTLYDKNIKNQPTWLEWLDDFSIHTKNSDTILLPFILDINESSVKQHGIYIKQRSMSVVLLLIDTSNSNIIWSNSKTVSGVRKTLDPDNKENFDYLDWEVLYERIFSSQLLINFPGRQIF